ncbi:MAG: hypothetical protein WAR24_11030 [Candidatus Acidiferrales bacterium]
MDGTKQSLTRGVIREKEAMARVETGSLTAKKILKKIFHAKSNDEILERASSRLKGTPVNSFTASARLRSPRTAKFLKRFWSDFHSLGEEDRKDAAQEIVSKLRQSTEFRSTKKGGRPRGITRDTNWRIMMAAALSFLGCSEAGMVRFLYPGLYSDHSNASGTDYALAGREAVRKFLESHAGAINQQKVDITKKLAIQIVRGSITKKNAEQIVRLEP